MKNLLKWEWKQKFQSKTCWGIGITLTLMNTIFLIITSVDGGQRGFELFLQGCSDFNSFLLFFIGIYAGIHVTGAFEERKIQAAVMAGNSRINILAVKLFSYSLSVAAFSVCAMSASLVVGVLTKEGLTLVDDFFMKFTPLGQTFLLLGDVSTNNMIISVVASILGLAVTMVLSYTKFRREELK